MSNHQASEQMIGYIYQIRYALYLLLKNKEEESNISIEKFDDIAFTIATYLKVKRCSC